MYLVLSFSEKAGKTVKMISVFAVFAYFCEQILQIKKNIVPPIGRLPCRNI